MIMSKEYTEGDLNQGQIENRQTDGGSGDVMLPVRRGRVDSLSLYEVTESELDALERGDGNSVELNFAIGLLSVMVTLVVALFTTNMSDLTKLCFVSAILITGLLGAFLLLKWWKNRHEISNLVKKIRSRLK